jgi:hypothetical protein
MWPQGKKSFGMSSGDLGGQAISPPRPNQRSLLSGGEMSAALQGRISDIQFLENKSWFWSPLPPYEVLAWSFSALFLYSKLQAIILKLICKSAEQIILTENSLTLSSPVMPFGITLLILFFMCYNVSSHIIILSHISTWEILSKSQSIFRSV